jgi:hypothetical protein
MNQQFAILMEVKKGDTAAIILDGVKIVQNKTENPSSPYPRALY